WWVVPLACTTGENSFPFLLAKTWSVINSVSLLRPELSLPIRETVKRRPRKLSEHPHQRALPHPEPHDQRPRQRRQRKGSDCGDAKWFKEISGKENVKSKTSKLWKHTRSQNLSASRRGRCGWWSIKFVARELRKPSISSNSFPNDRPGSWLRLYAQRWPMRKTLKASMSIVSSSKK